MVTVVVRFSEFMEEYSSGFGLGPLEGAECVLCSLLKVLTDQGALAMECNVGFIATCYAHGLKGVHCVRTTFCDDELVNASVDVIVEFDNVRIILKHLVCLFEGSKDNVELRLPFVELFTMLDWIGMQVQLRHHCV